MGLIDDIGPGNVGIDTSIFFYFIEEAPQFLPTLVPLFQDADKGRRSCCESCWCDCLGLAAPRHGRCKPQPGFSARRKCGEHGDHGGEAVGFEGSYTT